ncbi:MAG: prepilin-type N-terminal cleavage/methylation domain-containing protein [Aquabacterium sp.]|uniref:PulJ/GspJ family protein n=1 Tax=Aquabacterium sp. TaxID=1872578 RepID=UPI0025BE2A5C|nr:prepilin-type N-terminal cleavage/methylation domain-containing protein [Aquabacterium sp.]MBI3382157.1 prepilin-type N-terminal cleavage/methylation domain-containing protein [Aquabacterium sp.]
MNQPLFMPRLQRGFTLIEVLVSLLILAVLSATAWKGMDSISTARQVADGNLKQTLRLQSVITQFEADMGQVMDMQIVDGMQFDGAHLRLTRRSGEGLQVVTWYVQSNRLLRWASPVTTKVGELQRYWLSSYQLQGREPGTLTALKGVERWQVYCFRGGSMSSCQSTGDVVKAVGAAQSVATAGAGAAISQRQSLPNAVRCQVTLGEGSGFAGTLTRDVVLAPQLQAN